MLSASRSRTAITSSLLWGHPCQPVPHQCHPCVTTPPQPGEAPVVVPQVPRDKGRPVEETLRVMGARWRGCGDTVGGDTGTPREGTWGSCWRGHGDPTGGDTGTPLEGIRGHHRRGHRDPLRGDTLTPFEGMWGPWWRGQGDKGTPLEGVIGRCRRGHWDPLRGDTLTRWRGRGGPPEVDTVTPWERLLVSLGRGQRCPHRRGQGRVCGCP